jgi:hypothetical protein
MQHAVVQDDWKTHAAAGKKLVEAQERHMELEEVQLLQPLATALQPHELLQLKQSWRDAAAVSSLGYRSSIDLKRAI